MVIVKLTQFLWLCQLLQSWQLSAQCNGIHSGVERIECDLISIAKLLPPKRRKRTGFRREKETTVWMLRQARLDWTQMFYLEAICTAIYFTTHWPYPYLTSFWKTSRYIVANPISINAPCKPSVQLILLHLILYTRYFLLCPTECDNWQVQGVVTLVNHIWIKSETKLHICVLITYSLINFGEINEVRRGGEKS